MHSQQPPVPETAVSSQNILPCGDAEARSSASSLDSVPLSEAPFRTALDLPRGPADLADTDQPMSPNLEHKETERISGLFRTFQRRISLAIDRNTEKGPNSDSPNEIANSWSPKSPRLFSHVRASLADLGTYIARKSTVNADESAQPAADDKAVMPEKLASSSINVSDAHLQSQAHDSNAHIISSTYSGINDSISLDSAVPIQTSDAAAVDWTELDADRLGTDLYNGLHLPPREVAPLIGKKSEFHSLVLKSYLSNFTFTNMSLDQAFRSLCRVLHITGETQVIDRILLEFAHCFWKDNASSAFLASHSIVHELFRSVDIVYVVLFALVLLNTDLHHTKLARTQRMAKSVFVRNTLELVFDICRQKKQSDNTKSAENTEKDNDSNAGAVDTRDTPENLKVWGKRLESALKDMYVAVSDVPMMQVQTHGAESVDSTSTAVNLSIDKPHSLETSIEQGTRGYPVIQGVLFTKQHMVERGERARDRTWRKVWVTINVSADRFTTSGGGGVEMYVNRLVAGKVVGKASDFGPDEGVTTPIIGHGRDMYLSVDRHAILKPTASPKESPDAYNTPNGDADEDKTREIDLSDTYPVYAAMGATPTAVTPPMHIVYKLISQAPQIHSLIHACAGKVAYAPGRPRVFFVNFANGATHLFSCPGPGECALEAWVTWINYYAGSFSKRLGEEGISSMDYGWKLPVLPSSHSSSAGMLSPELLSVVSNGSLSGKSIKSALGSKSQQEKVVKLDTWTKPTISTRLLAQLESVQLQLSSTVLDLTTHEALYEQMISHHGNNSANLAICKTNWTAKKEYLDQQVQKYTMWRDTMQQGPPTTITSSASSGAGSNGGNVALRAIMRRDRTRNASAGFGSGTSSILVFNDVEKDKRAEKESGLVVVDLKPIFPGQDLLESPMP